MIVPFLHFEKQIQVGDLTRFDANKTILVKGSAGAINSITIKPGAEASAIQVFSATPKSWFLDYVFNDTNFDVDTTNNRIYYEQSGNVSFKVITPGSYSQDDLMGAIETALEDFDCAVTVDNFRRVTIAAEGIKLYPKYEANCFLKHIGFYKKAQTQGNPIEYVLKKVTLTVTTNASPTPETETKTYYVEVYSEEGDALFSSDFDLLAEEPDILKWVPAGRASFVNIHRAAQKQIIDFLDRAGFRNTDGEKLTKFDVLDKSDVNTWATYIAHRLIQKGNSNSEDDVFKAKAKAYEKAENEARQRLTLSLDLNKDKIPDKNSGPDISSGRLFLR